MRNFFFSFSSLTRRFEKKNIILTDGRSSSFRILTRPATRNYKPSPKIRFNNARGAESQSIANREAPFFTSTSVPREFLYLVFRLGCIPTFLCFTPFRRTRNDEMMKKQHTIPAYGNYQRKGRLRWLYPLYKKEEQNSSRFMLLTDKTIVYIYTEWEY